MILSILIGQFPISLDIENNYTTILSILKKSKIDDLVVLPEGALSGYSDDISFLEDIDTNKLHQHLLKLKEEVINRRIHLIFGSCIYENQAWYNAGICYSYCNPDFVYKKVNLAIHERGSFCKGDKLSVLKLKLPNGIANIGIQLCRELRYPEQWRWLAINGADIFVYLSNAIAGNGLSVWRSHLVSRAAENLRYLVSSNNAHINQHCPTMLISPDGNIIEEVLSSNVAFFRNTIDTTNVSNWYINDMRNDIIKLIDK